MDTMRHMMLINLLESKELIQKVKNIKKRATVGDMSPTELSLLNIVEGIAENVKLTSRKYLEVH